ncbi:MAG: phage shock protein PspA [Colwellia sp.]|nr:phage shock protein PspA [Colwellia sp.]
MGLFSRFTDIVNANINSMLDKAEHPEKMIRLIIQEMEETLVEVRSTAAKNIAEKKSLVREIRNLEASIENWHNKAELAISKGREDLAKSALTEKHKAKEQVDYVREQLTQLDEYLNGVQEDAQRLQEKLSEAKRRQETLILRQQSAQVRLKVREKAAVHNIEDAIGKFERYQQKIDKVEAQIEAYDMTQNSDLDSQFRALETNENIEQELELLKKKVVNA